MTGLLYAEYGKKYSATLSPHKTAVRPGKLRTGNPQSNERKIWWLKCSYYRQGGDEG
jgi:hypothetical protein